MWATCRGRGVSGSPVGHCHDGRCFPCGAIAPQCLLAVASTLASRDTTLSMSIITALTPTLHSLATLMTHSSVPDVEASLQRCTLGEMVQALGDVYGRYTGGPEW